MAAIMGMSIVVVALLLATSVTIATMRHTRNNINQSGRVFSTMSLSPIHMDKPDTYTIIQEYMNNCTQRLQKL